MVARKSRLSRSGSALREKRLAALNPSTKTYGEISWSWEDVKSERPRWSEQRCREWLENNAKYLRDAGIEAGWAAMRTLLSEAD